MILTLAQQLSCCYSTCFVFFRCQLLDTCTEKLGLVSAARKVFLSDGTPVTQASQLQRDVDVFVSCGEAFRDPYATIRGTNILGIIFESINNMESQKPC